MVFKKILCPIDGSTCSLRALETAAGLAHDLQAGLTICYVVDPVKAAAIGYPEPTLTATYLDALDTEADTTLTHAAVAVENHVRAATVRLDGAVVDSILDYVRSSGTDLIVMGSHGRGGLQRVFLGSVAEGVLRHAKVPVMIIRFHEAHTRAEAPRVTEKPAVVM